MATKATGAPTCKLCKAAHWSHEPHIWGGQATQPVEDKPARVRTVSRNEITEGKPAAPPVVTAPLRAKGKDRDHELDLWKARALAAETELETRKKSDRDRQERARQKRKPDV